MSEKISVKFIVRSIVAAMVCVAVIFAAEAVKSIKNPKKEVKEVLTKEEILKCQELTTLKYKYTEICSIKSSSLFGLAKGYNAIKYTGIIRAGIEDMSGVDISYDKNNVSLVLPRSKIIDNTILSQGVFDSFNNIFAPITPDDVVNLINTSKNKFLSSKEVEELLPEADERNEKLFRTMLQNSGAENISIKFK